MKWNKVPPVGLVIHSKGITVSIEEREPDAKGMRLTSFRLSRPIGRVSQIDTAGPGTIGEGTAHISPDGRYLLIADWENLWLFDLEAERLMHRSFPDDRFYLDTPVCRGSLIEVVYSDRADRSPETLRITIEENGDLSTPWSWNDSQPAF